MEVELAHDIGFNSNWLSGSALGVDNVVIGDQIVHILYEALRVQLFIISGQNARIYATLSVARLAFAFVRASVEFHVFWVGARDAGPRVRLLGVGARRTRSACDC